MKYRLEELVDLQIGRTPPRKEFEWFNTNCEGYKWVSIKDMGNSGRFISDTSEYLTEAAQKRFGIPIVEKGTLLLSFKLTVGRLCITTDKMLTNEAIAQLPIKDTNIVDRDFLYYYLKNYNFHQLGSTSSIATAINSTYLKKMEIDLPPIDQQRAIAAVLSSIDDKIESNNAINNNLMHVASSLFSKALEDNADTLIATPLGEIADVKGGKRLPKGVNLQSVPNSHPYIRVRDLTNTAIVHINDDFEYVDDDTQRGISRYIVATNDVLLSIVGTIGLVSIVHPSLDNANLTENCVKLTKLKGITPQYLFLYLRSSDGQHEIARSTVGAVQAKLPIKNIQAINVPVLPSTQGKNLCETLNPLFSNMESLVAEIYSLTRLKNTLLPKLLSGEIDVSEVEF